MTSSAGAAGACNAALRAPPAALQQQYLSHRAARDLSVRLHPVPARGSSWGVPGAVESAVTQPRLSAAAPPRQPPVPPLLPGASRQDCSLLPACLLPAVIPCRWAPTPSRRSCRQPARCRSCSGKAGCARSAAARLHVGSGQRLCMWGDATSGKEKEGGEV